MYETFKWMKLLVVETWKAGLQIPVKIYLGKRIIVSDARAFQSKLKMQIFDLPSKFQFTINFKQLANDRPSWRSAIPTGVAPTVNNNRSCVMPLCSLLCCSLWLERLPPGDSALRQKRDNRMPAQFQPLLNSDIVKSVREFSSFRHRRTHVN